MDEETSQSEQTHLSGSLSDGDSTSDFDFGFESSPAISDDRKFPTYPLKVVPGQEHLEYPEMDFRALSSVKDTQYLTHVLHKHPAIFIPQIPEYIIEQFSSVRNVKGEQTTVMDPFSGSGTTGVEAKIKGRNYLGVEINPLSKLVSEVSTSPVPHTVLDEVVTELTAHLERVDTSEKFEEYDVEFLDQTNKGHWFEESAQRELTAVRKVIQEFTDQFNPYENLTRFEEEAIKEGSTSLLKKIKRWLVLMLANAVYEVSNADPGVSKAYKSPDIKEKISAGEHPQSAVSVYQEELADSKDRLEDLWDAVYPEKDIDDLESNPRHQAKIDIRLADAREFQYPEYSESVDLAITSPPYINAMNYYRGTKLRLFWIYDLIEDEFEADELRRSIVGTNASRISEAEIDLPGSLRDRWKGSTELFNATSLPALDEDIEEIHEGHLTEANRRAYTTWRFFAHDILRALTRSYEHLKRGAHFFFIIGENTISGRHISSHRYVADIAQNLGQFEGHGGNLESDEGFNLIGFAWDEITNRDLFQGRDHGSGVIDCEWVVILQKPTN
ncbi:MULTISPECIES: DNA methyltransferase [Halobacterium]|uniref:DNA methyltransferase n=1 Tax=Halobacterium TaxID=2239 RepID=UPI0009EA6607|nr:MULTISPECIES: DNA methyltransferase [Halobacterium]MCG1004273.1 site-specific DNA-methyltransferase [Halobacterium noricense]